MLKHNNEVLYSASDLVAFLGCAHATTLDLVNLETPLKVAEDNDHAKLIQQKGFAHEASHLASLKAAGLQVVDLSLRQPLDDACKATVSAMESGAHIVFQATLRNGKFFGHADFLRRVDSPSRFGYHSYEVVDTKLAKSAKSRFLVQLAFYSSLLEGTQSAAPKAMHVVLGDGREDSYRVADFASYTSVSKERFAQAVAAPERPDTYPRPCAHCDTCRWRDICKQRWLDDDHLSQVAGITKIHISRLEGAGVRTMHALANLPAEAHVPKMVPAMLAKLRHQASLQVAYREDGTRRYEVLPGACEPLRGFVRLPPSSPHDLYFDIEGDPLVDGGLEYLLGIHYRDLGSSCFKSFWAHSRDAERTSFETFMDFISQWLAAHPDAHIYHYAAYEDSALKRLMTLHGTREADVDRLLRERRLIDLFKVVREALRTSEPAYSLKNIEHFYMSTRKGEVQSAGNSIVFYERWKDSGDESLLNQIEEYNRDDLTSTRMLHEWLLSIRPPTTPWRLGGATNADDKPVAEATPAEKRLEDYRRKLLGTLPQDQTIWSPKDQLCELVFQLLDFHRREAKPEWWSVFDRMDKTDDELIEDIECIGGMTRSTVTPPRPDKRSVEYDYGFPEQDFKLRSGLQVRRCDNAAPAGTIQALDEDRCTVTLRIGAKAPELPLTLSIGPSGPINADAMRDALFRVGDALAAGDGKFQAGFELLQRNLPRFVNGTPSGPLVLGKLPLVEEVADLVGSLDRSYLVIQGPPGSGKTYTASRVIVSLLQRGNRVGVAANSHKAVHNVLDAVEKHAAELAFAFDGIKKASRNNEDSVYEGSFISSEFTNPEVAGAGAQLIAGTAWLFSDPQFEGALDYLFVDEAGQVSLANVLAMGTSAQNIVLLGDQMQLGQPSQAVHPGRSGLSALDFLLEEVATIPETQGVFLPDTFRMHPDVCRFISDAVYDGRLRSAPKTEQQRLELDVNAHASLQQTGLRFVAVQHDGCSQRSEQEATVVATLYENLLTQRWIDCSGTVRQLTAADILVVAPYNMQVNLLKRTLGPEARVGTVDKFQGQEAAVVIVSMTTSSGEFLPRDIEFLYSRNRLNVAISRARCLALVIANPALLYVQCSTPEQMRLVNTLCWAFEYSHASQVARC